jgi:hypothetical protein
MNCPDAVRRSLHPLPARQVLSFRGLPRFLVTFRGLESEIYCRLLQLAFVKSRLFILLSACWLLLLLVAIVSAIMAVRSIYRRDILTLASARLRGDAARYVSFNFVSENSVLSLDYGANWNAQKLGFTNEMTRLGHHAEFSVNWPIDRPSWLALLSNPDRRFGFAWKSPSEFGHGEGPVNWRIAAPWWLFPLLCGPPGFFGSRRSYRRFQQRRRIKHNLCATCAYDLRASKERCPECGTPIAHTIENQKSKACPEQSRRIENPLV